eukprot:2211170-Pyramimonas_sp.AAC.1
MLLARPPHPMTKELVSNKNLKQMGALCTDLGHRPKVARRAPGTLETQDLSSWESRAHEGMVTRSLSFVIFQGNTLSTS